MRPALSAYLDRLKARPSFKAAIQDDEMPLPMLLAGLRRTFLGV
jgi:glutathione S-transferase